MTKGRCRSVLRLRNLTTGSLLGFDSSLLTHSSENNDVGVFLLGGEKLGYLLTNFPIGNLDIILGLTIIGHQREETIIRDIKQLVFLAANVGDVHVVGGRAEIFEFLASEDIDGDEMNLGVAVFASLGSGHVDNLARAILDHNEAVLSKSAALDRKRC